MSAIAHLNEAAAQAIELPAAKRLQYIRSPRWIGYPRSKVILDKLEDLLVYPPCHRMPNLLIAGDTNNGKTMLVNRFCSRHPAIDNPNGDGIVVPVLDIQAPPVPEEGRFYCAILERLFAPYKHSDRVDKKQMQVFKMLKYVGLKMLIIDEIHHLLAGSLNKQRAFLNVIKYLGNELQIPIVAVGTKDAFRALQTDPQLSNRFEPAMLPRWDSGTEFMRLLASFEKMLPLKLPSNLHQTELASRIHSMSEGYIGEVSHLLVEAAVAAVQTGKEKIDLKLLASIGWVQPSERKYRLNGKN